MIVDTPIGAFLRYTKKPKKIARTMNSSEMIAVVALAAERGHDQDQGQVREDEEQALGLLADAGLDNGADGLAVIADRGKQRAVVMHTTEEDAADENPQQHRDPTENSGLDRAVDRAGARDGGEVVAHKDRGLCGAVVHAVFQLVSRGRAGRVDAPLFGQPSAVENVAQGENDNANNQNYSSIH